MRIGQLADATGVTTRTLRYYESEGLLREPGRTLSGYRDYPAETVDRLAFIRNAQAPAGSSKTLTTDLTAREPATNHGHAHKPHIPPAGT